MQLTGDSFLSPARGILFRLGFIRFGFGGLNNSVAGE